MLAIALDKRDNVVANGDERACVFWLPLGDGYGRCSAYAGRPSVCRTYPAYLRDGAVHLRDDVHCPPRSWNLASLKLTTWRRELLRGQLQQAAYDALVGEWNEHVERTEKSYSLSAYYAHLMRVYGELGPLHDAVDDELLRDEHACEAFVESVRSVARRALSRKG